MTYPGLLRSRPPGSNSHRDRLFLKEGENVREVGRSGYVFQGYQFRYFFGRIASHCVPEIPIHLQAQPDIRWNVQDSSETQRGVRRDGTFAACYFIQAWEGYS